MLKNSKMLKMLKIIKKKHKTSKTVSPSAPAVSYETQKNAWMDSQIFPLPVFLWIFALSDICSNPTTHWLCLCRIIETIF